MPTAADATRGQITFAAWADEVSRLLDVTDPASDEAAALQHQAGALGKAYQVDGLSPRAFVEGVEAALALVPEPEDAEVPKDVQAARDAADEAAEAGASPGEQEEASKAAAAAAQDEDEDDDEPDVAGDDSRFPQVFGEDGPEDTGRSEDPDPEQPFQPTDEHPAEAGKNFSEDASAE